MEFLLVTFFYKYIAIFWSLTTLGYLYTLTDELEYVFNVYDICVGMKIDKKQNYDASSGLHTSK